MKVYISILAAIAIFIIVAIICAVLSTYAPDWVMHILGGASILFAIILLAALVYGEITKP